MSDFEIIETLNLPVVFCFLICCKNFRLKRFFCFLVHTDYLCFMSAYPTAPIFREASPMYQSSYTPYATSSAMYHVMPNPPATSAAMYPMLPNPVVVVKSAGPAEQRMTEKSTTIIEKEIMPINHCCHCCLTVSTLCLWLPCWISACCGCGCKRPCGC
jgi:hypothetical protein